MSQKQIALVGDFDAQVVAHQAIEKCFALAQQCALQPVKRHWLSTEIIVEGDVHQFDSFQGIWCVPASPYRSTQGALWAIQYARTHAVPFLGTCGGYQHALLEYARNVLGLKHCGHTELDPAAPLPLLERMHCPLIEQSQKIHLTNDGFRSIYGADSGQEGFNCSYGLNPKYEHLFSGTVLEIVARSEEGQARAFQLKGHPFFIGTQFQPERRVFTGSLHPLVNAFFQAAAA